MLHLAAFLDCPSAIKYLLTELNPSASLKNCLYLTAKLDLLKVLKKFANFLRLSEKQRNWFNRLIHALKILGLQAFMITALDLADLMRHKKCSELLQECERTNIGFLPKFIMILAYPKLHKYIDLTNGFLLFSQNKELPAGNAVTELVLREVLGW